VRVQVSIAGAIAPAWRRDGRELFFHDDSKEKYQISTNGGTWPRWSRDGQFLCYVDADGRLVAVSVKQESAFQYASATPLFEFPLPPATTATPNVPYDVAADGRFLVSAPAATDERTSISVMLNWTASLSR
jgi:eukaryotic-like serine/threonine-protein kinase